MVNPVDPNSSNPPVTPPDAPPTATGAFNAEGEHKYLGMTFTAKEWKDLMKVMLQQMCDYIDKTIKKSTEKMKKDWARERGDDPGN